MLCFQLCLSSSIFVAWRLRAPDSCVFSAQVLRDYSLSVEVMGQLVLRYSLEWQPSNPNCRAALICHNLRIRVL